MDKIINTPGAWSLRAIDPKTENEPWRAALWSEQGQRERFEFIAGLLVPLLEPNDSVLDYGCGFGDFCTYLPMNLGLRYIGYDWSDQMIRRARKRNSESRFRRFDTFELSGGFDHVVVIGTFNLANLWAKERTATIMRRLVEKTNKTVIASFYSQEDDALVNKNCINYTSEDFIDLDFGGVPEPKLVNETPEFHRPRHNDLVVMWQKQPVRPYGPNSLNSLNRVNSLSPRYSRTTE